MSAPPTVPTSSELKLNYHTALSQFLLNANKNWDDAKKFTQALQQSIHAIMNAPAVKTYLDEPHILNELITIIHMVLAIDVGDSMKHVEAQRRGNPNGQRELGAVAMVYLHNILTLLLTDSVKVKGSKRLANINARLLNLNNSKIRYIKFGLPPVSQKTENWKFYQGQLELTPSRRCDEVPFTHLQHVVHEMEDVINILTAKPGHALFSGKEHPDYSGLKLWWLAPKCSGPHQSPALNGDDSRYGCVRFYFPVNEILSSRNHSFRLGTRHYTREWAHTTLLTDFEVSGLWVDVSEVNLADNELVAWKKKEPKAIWKCYRDTQHNWDHLEFAVHIERDLEEFEQVKIDFVEHNGYCVTHKRRVDEHDHNGYRREALKCKCESTTEAMKRFKTACKVYSDKNGVDLLSKLYQGDFFEDEIWNQLQAVQL